ncbi:MAG: DEAD/DEAH box helicase, partial [Armatimonadetes bacterium]|nr:DEAD/DEAH box helicase [Armatimonadota bacterium]
MSRKFDAPTAAQRMAWPVIAQGRSTLVFSPTGSGKTLAAFLWAINELIERGDAGELPDKPYVVYVSPLRALANDVEKNLLQPLAEMREIAGEWGSPFPDLRVAVRTGDTPPGERQRMRRRPPHILITTPESLYLLITSGFREHLDEVRYVIVDEIHHLCGDKRGAHLSITLERLEELVRTGPAPLDEGQGWDPRLLSVAGRWRDVRGGLTTELAPDRGSSPVPGVAVPPSSRPPVRIGLSATQSPVEEVARFLVGRDDGGRERECAVVDLGVRRDLDVQVVTAVPNLAEARPEAVLEAIYERLLELIAEHRTTLIFCNSKYWTERVAAKLNQLSEDRGLGLRIGAHHGSMARQFRLEMEDALKQGELRAIVATSTLELGIDIGRLDLVCQIESPKNVAAGLQRIGRAGHLLGLTSKGRLFPISRDDLVELAVLTRAMLAGDLEPVRVPPNCLDVLAQQLCAMAAIGPGPPEEMLRVVRRAYGFADLKEDDFLRVLEQLAGSHAGQELFETRARIHWDRATNRVSAARGALTIAQQNAGTIPEYAEYVLQSEDYDKKLGTLDEAFVQRLRPGQRFAFGTRTWEHSRVDRNAVFVRDARGRAPTIPYWLGPDVIPRSFRLGEQVASFRSEMFRRLFDEPQALAGWLERGFHLDESGARQITEYFLEEAHSLDAWPGRETLVVETSRNPLGHAQHLVHSPYGGRLNEAWAEALVYAAREALNLELQVSYSDDALVIHMPPESEIPAAEVLALVTPDNLTRCVEGYVATSAMFPIRFRHAAVRALAVLRMSRGKKRAVWQQEAAARRLEREVAGHARFPLMAETARECLEDYLDLAGLRQLLAEIATGRMRVVHADVEVPSPFGHGLLLAGQFGAVTEAERRERRSELLVLHREVLKQILDEDGIRSLLDPAVVADFEARRQGTHE